MIFKVCNTLMSFNTILATSTSTGDKEAEKFQNTAEPILSGLITAFCAIMGAVAAFWGVWCAIAFFRASNGEKREEAKKKLIYSIVACVVAVVLIVILLFVKKNLTRWVGGDNGDIFPKQ